MTNLGNRILKAENALDCMAGGSNGVKMFFRENSEDRRPEERMAEFPDFRGKIQVMCFGTANLGPAR